MDAKTIEWIIFGPLIVGLLLVSWWAMSESHRRLDDPNDDRTLHLDQLSGKLALAAYGTFRVTIYRQSGNIHAEKLVTGSAQDALATALATFRRAKIDAVHVGANSETELKIGRLYHDHRGRNEGKKVGKAHITLVERIAAPTPQSAAIPAPGEPSISFQPIGLTCDCGTRVEVAFDQVREPRRCASCGQDATLTPAQIAQLETAAEEARAEALARYRAGETDIAVERRSKLVEDQPSTKTGVPPSGGT
jgi:hypothetical protein